MILVLVFIQFRLHDFSSSFYSISDIILVLVFIQFLEDNFSFHLVLVLDSCLILVLVVKFSKLQRRDEIIRTMAGYRSVNQLFDLPPYI